MERIKNAKPSKQLIFILLAVAMIILTLVVIIYFVTSLSQRINTALKIPPPPNQSVQFDIQGFKNLHVTQ